MPTKHPGVLGGFRAQSSQPRFLILSCGANSRPPANICPVISNLRAQKQALSLGHRDRMPHSPPPPLAGHQDMVLRPCEPSVPCGLCMSHLFQGLHWWLGQWLDKWAQGSSDIMQPQTPFHWTQFREVRGERGNTSSLAQGPKAFLQGSMVPGFSSSLLWTHQQKKGRSQGGPCLHHTAQPRDMRPLDVGVQPVWSSVLCCVGTEIRNLWKASHVWDQARCRGTQSPTSCLQGLSGYYCRRKIPQPAVPMIRADATTGHDLEVPWRSL